ncbi:uncharacterized protein LOC142554821 [Primulina tabacum]|uniref:uncharacterized protein LOC142554821 n=1 Tax=Primulina tabacum TaxID=48773 RepID=UPI003F5A22BB
MLSSQGLVLATAMAVSAGTIILFDFFKEKCFSNIRQNQDCPLPEKKALKSCLSSDSGSKKSDQTKKKNKKKNRVKFAEDVKDSSKKIDGESYRNEQTKFGEIRKSCGNEIQKIPANHVALYSGILKDRVHRMQYSH